MTAVHHTNMDLYEYIPEKDQQFNSELIAYLIYQVAQSDQLLPRKKFNSPVPSLKGNVTFQIPGYLNATQVTASLVILTIGICLVHLWRKFKWQPGMQNRLTQRHIRLQIHH